ncbi:hypothetical protein D3C72_2326500 [compost metagenome]
MAGAAVRLDLQSLAARIRAVVGRNFQDAWHGSPVSRGSSRVDHRHWRLHADDGQALPFILCFGILGPVAAAGPIPVSGYKIFSFATGGPFLW